MNIVLHVRGTLPSLYYGGAERAVWYLAKELVALGHKVTLLGLEGSASDFCDVVIYDPAKPLQQYIPADADIVHITEDHFNQELEKPVVVTVQGNPENYEGLHINTIFVSGNHARRYGSESFVYNGMDWSSYPAFEPGKKRNTFHFLGNAAWNVKNVKGAIGAVLKTKKETLEILGGNRFHPNTFSFSNRIHYWGMVNDIKKAEVMNASKGLLFPVIWDEPFGIAITESLYYGCAVFGTPYGSLPELVVPEVGFLSNKSAEITSALANSSAFPEKVCHDYANEYFNSRIMALSYLEKYEKVLNGHTLNAAPPKLTQKPVPHPWYK